MLSPTCYSFILFTRCFSCLWSATRFCAQDINIVDGIPMHMLTIWQTVSPIDICLHDNQEFVHFFVPSSSNCDCFRLSFLCVRKICSVPHMMLKLQRIDVPCLRGWYFHSILLMLLSAVHLGIGLTLPLNLNLSHFFCMCDAIARYHSLLIIFMSYMLALLVDLVAFC